MSDMKEFLERECIGSNEIDTYTLGMFFWDRGGKQFVEEECESEFIIINNLAKSYLNPSEESYWDYSHLEDDSKRKAQNFLDCVACLGEEKVKELISKLKEERDD